MLPKNIDTSESELPSNAHLSPTYGMAYFVGGRHGMPEVLEINSAAMAADGYVFYKITNDVWQTDYIPAKYIKGIADLPYASE